MVQSAVVKWYIILFRGERVKSYLSISIRYNETVHIAVVCCVNVDLRIVGKAFEHWREVVPQDDDGHRCVVGSLSGLVCPILDLHCELEKGNQCEMSESLQ